MVESKKGHILIVEDETDIAEMLVYELERKNFSLIIKKDGASGLLSFKENRPQLVIADIVLPKLNGIEMIEKMKDIDKSVPVICVSGAFSGRQDYCESLANVCATYPKPFAIKDILNAIKKALDKK